MLLSRSTALLASKTSEIAFLKESLLLISFRLKQKTREAVIFTPLCLSIMGLKKNKSGFPGFAKQVVVLLSPIQFPLPLLKQQYYLLHLQSHLYAFLCEITAAPRYSLGSREDAVHGNISKQDHQRLPILQLTLCTKHITCLNFNVTIYSHLHK